MRGKISSIVCGLCRGEGCPAAAKCQSWPPCCGSSEKVKRMGRVGGWDVRQGTLQANEVGKGEKGNQRTFLAKLQLNKIDGQAQYCDEANC